MIINRPQKYDSVFFSSIPKPVINVAEYCEAIKTIPKLLEESYPLLKMVALPTRRVNTAFIQGLLLPKYVIQELHLLPEHYEYYGLQIFANIPEDFQVRGVQVYDSCKRINWDIIHYHLKHCHYFEGDEREHGYRKMCTHHSDFITQSNCVIGVLDSAFSLFQEYKRYDKFKQFDLACLPHDYKKVI